MELSPLFERYANHSERRADAGSSQSAGIALRHHLAFARHEFRSKTSDGFVCRLLLEMDLPGFGDLTVIRIREADFFGGKPALVQHDHAAFGPFDRLGYIHSVVILASFNCSGGRDRKRIARSAVHRPGGMWVKPLVAMIEVTAIMEL